MNLILFSTGEVSAERVLTLTDERFQHLTSTLCSKAGDTLRIGEINGLMGTAEVLSIDHSSARLALDLREPPPAKLPLTVILALPRPKMMRRIFRTIAELGIGQLHIINSYRVEKSYWQSPALSEEKIRGYLLDGLQQARDTMLPEVHFHRWFKPFAEDQLPGLAAGSVKLIAHPALGKPCPQPLDKNVILAIGPEGGFTPYEVQQFSDCGFEGIHLGPRILKVETAITALTSKLFSS